jgi:eukaryotic-like serine/threonine-protein kinase
LPADRFASASEFALAWQGKGDLSVLDRYGPTGATGDAVPALHRSHLREIALWTLVATLAVALAWTLRRPRQASDPAVVQFIIATPDSERAAVMSPYSAAISPDGRTVLYSVARASGGTALQAVRTDRLDSRAIPGTANASQPIFSPDGQFIAFESGNKLRKMRLDGGTPTVLSDGRSNDGAAWTINDDIVLGADAGFHGLSRVSANGGQLTEITRPDTSKGETEHWYPVALDDGTTIVFAVIGGSLSTAELAITSLTDGKVTRLGVSGFRPLAVIDGMLLFVQLDGTVSAVKLDARARRVVGTPVPVYGPVAASVGNGEIFIARSGALVAGRAGTLSQMLWLGRDGVERPLIREVRGFGRPRLSHDERRIAVAIADGQSSDIWIHDLAMSTTSRLTSVQSASSPVWSSDDKRIFYLANGPDGKPAIWSQQVDGSSAPEKKGDVIGIPASLALAPDGRSLLYHSWNRSSYDIFEMRVDSAGTSRPFLATPSMELFPEFSPDGHSVAIVTEESGIREVYVRSYPVPGARLQISAGGGASPQWSADGKQVFYQSGTALLAATLVAGPTGLQVAARDTVLARTRFADGTGFERTRDGTRFLGLVPVGGDLQLVVSPNWIVELREKVSARRSATER